MIKNKLTYFLLFAGLVLICFDNYFGEIYAKIIGFILVMFSLYKLQSAIPYKNDNATKKDENL